MRNDYEEKGIKKDPYGVRIFFQGNSSVNWNIPYLRKDYCFPYTGDLFFQFHGKQQT